MAKINISIEATLQDFSVFADELGYLNEVAVGAETDGTTIIGKNPQTKQEFLSEDLTKVTVNELAKVKVQAIDREVLDKRVLDKEAIKASIANAVTVTIT